MILCAGVGERMRPLTERTPKPLLRVADIPLLEYHIRALASAGFSDLVVNVSHLADQIMDYCGDGSRWGVGITWSREEQPLETAGGIQQALPLLGSEPFLVINGDVWIDYPFNTLRRYTLKPWEQAHLVLVDNPPQHPQGDFCLAGDGGVRYRAAEEIGYTYAGLGLYSPGFFADMSPGKLALRPLLDAAIASGALGAEHYRGDWEDVGTPRRLQALNARIRSAAKE